MGHAIELPGKPWSVWREALLRSAGFPAAGLALFSSRECGVAADSLISGNCSRQEFEEVFAMTASGISREINRLAHDELLREAITWQNRSALIGLDKVAEAGPEPRRHSKHRLRERMIARYWQRYCGKTETVGFFGPVCWVKLDDSVKGMAAQAGPGLVRDRRVYFEHWALTAVAARLCADSAVKPWLAPALCPQLSLRGREVIDPVRPPVQLTREQATVVGYCDGRKLAGELAREVLGEASTRLRQAADVYLLLDQLVDRGIVSWDFNLPVSFDAERIFHDRIAQIEVDSVRLPVEARLRQLVAKRDAVRAAAGDPHALGEALASLERTFTEVSGEEATRRPGEMYVGRTLCVEETTRDLEVRVGSNVLEPVASGLAVVLAVARWLCGALAAAYCAELMQLHKNLSAELKTTDVPLGLLWFLAQDAFYGSDVRPADQVRAELCRRWESLFSLDEAQRPGSRLTFSSAAVAQQLAELFPEGGPTWASARIHSPDLQFGATSADAFAMGEFTAVLGEMHSSWAAAGCAMFVDAHAEPERLRRALRHDLGRASVHPLLPVDWPRHTARLAFALQDEHDVQLGFSAAPGADPEKLLPISSVVVRHNGTGLEAFAADGRSWPLLEVFSRLLSESAVEAFKVVSARSHTPRITVDRLVVSRETWVIPVEDCPVTKVTGEQEEYLAARRWKKSLGLPDYIFAKISSEVKPIFVDLTSPIYTSILAVALRAAYRQQGSEATATVTEMLPTPDEAWVPDAHGQTYVAELRLHVRDDQVAQAGPRGAA